MLDAAEQHELDDAVARAFTSLEVLARALHVKDAQLAPTLDAIVAAAVTTLPPVRDAGLILLVRGKLVPQAVTGRAPRQLDLLQQQTGQGPCIEAARQQAVIRIDDIRADTRWPVFCAQAWELGVRSQLCLPLWAGERHLGTLSLYADAPAAFTRHDERVTTVFAALAATALAEAQRAEQMRTAVASRDLIGQAKGILMERHRITADEAFARLARASQDANLKLSEVAARLVETGQLSS